jgi:hypothetical protein
MANHRITIEWLDGTKREFGCENALLEASQVVLSTYADGFMDTREVIPLFEVRLVTIEFLENRRRAEAKVRAERGR